MEYHRGLHEALSTVVNANRIWAEMMTPGDNEEFILVRVSARLVAGEDDYCFADMQATHNGMPYVLHRSEMDRAWNALADRLL